MQLQQAELGRLAGAAGDVVVRVEGDATTRVSGLAYDSRRVRPGDLFFCVPGARVDGHVFAGAAVRAGARALCVQQALDLPVPQIVVRRVRTAMGRIAAEAFGRPGDGLLLLGVTGTNGKTTTAWLLESILAAEGCTPGLIGTIESRAPGVSAPGVRTTPEAVDLQALLADMRAAGADSVAMEVTSHGLALERVEGLRFAAAGFTNLSQDHLDFHADMEEYFHAKKSLFEAGRVDRAAVNADDDYGRRLLASLCVPALSFGKTRHADVRALRVRVRAGTTRFTAVTPKGEIKLETGLVGAFNVSNCLAAVAIALQAGIAPAAIEAGIRAVRCVPGRFEAVRAGQPFDVVVDYAHTPDSLENSLRAARAVARGRVLCVFGCGGDRDRAKRPAMGRMAAALSDVAIVTSDNPRSEDPDAIIAEILAGMPAAGAGARATTVVTDRAEAIRAALREAGAGDVVLIAGKGHETGQEFADRTIPFDDRTEARAALAALGWEAAP